MAQSIENLDQRLRGQEALLPGEGPSVVSTTEPMAHPQESRMICSHHQSRVCCHDPPGLVGQTGSNYGWHAYPLWHTIPSSQAAHRKPGAGGPEAQDPNCMGGEGYDVLADRSGEANFGAEGLPRLDIKCRQGAHNGQSYQRGWTHRD